MANERTATPGSPDASALRAQLYASIRRSLEDAIAEIPSVERIGQRRKLILRSYPQTPEKGDEVALKVAHENFPRAVRRATGEFRSNPDAQRYRDGILNGATYIQIIVAREIVLRQGTKNPISLVESLKNHLEQMQGRYDAAGLLGAGLFADFATSIRQKPPVPTPTSI